MQKGLVQALSPALSGAQRRQLRAMAHHHKPIVTVGHAGVSEHLVDNLITALNDHELVKVKVLKSYAEPIEGIATSLAEESQSACVQQIGRILVFYKQHPEEPKILLTTKRKPKNA